MNSQIYVSYIIVRKTTQNIINIKNKEKHKNKTLSPVC